MKNKSSILAIAVLVLLSAGVTVFFTNRGMDGAEVMPMMATEEARSGMGVAPGLSGAVPSMKLDVASTGKMIAPDFYPTPNIEGDALSVDERAVVKSSNHQVIVNDVASYIRQMKEYITSIDGKVLNTSIDTQAKYQYGSIYAKVPVVKFDEATGRVTEGVKKVLGENINSSDITGQVENTNGLIESLMNIKKMKEAELADLKAKNSSNTMIASKQMEIEATQRQVERFQKQAENQSEQIEYASVNISAANSERYFLGSAYEPTLREEFDRALESLGGSGRALRSLAVWIVVYSVIWGPLYLIVRWIKRRGDRVSPSTDHT